MDRAGKDRVGKDMEIGENRKIENVRIVVQISGLEGGGGE